MIGFLKGKIAGYDSQSLLVDVNGVGYQVIRASKDLLAVNIGQDALIYTYLNVKDDALQLFGFSTEQEKFVFENLITVSKVGPKIAASILLAYSADQVMSFISGQNVQMLASVPGLGKKTAERIVLELKEKLGTAFSVEITHENSVMSSAKDALMALGYSQNEAISALKELDALSTVEDMVKKALVRLAK